MSYHLYNKITYKNIEFLYNTIKFKNNNISAVKKIYSSDNKNFQETFNFLIDIKLIKITGNKLNIIRNDIIDLKKKIIISLCKNQEYSSGLKNYINQFIKEDSGIYYFKPSYSYNLKTSGLRNFLISLKYLKLSKERYYLLENYIYESVGKIKFSPEQLKSKIQDQEKIGLEAELLILSYEKNILRKESINLKPSHISIEDVSAGYDIESYRKKRKEISKIFIEVKAVRLSDYRFYLSSGEYEFSLNNRDSYYIYLLPVDKSEKTGFDLDKLLIINNIKENVINNKLRWNIEKNNYIINRK